MGNRTGTAPFREPIQISTDSAPALVTSSVCYGIAEDDRLLVERLLWSTPIDLSGLSRVWHDPNGLKGSIRIVGNGGLFSFSGVYSNKTIGRYRLFGTDATRFVVMQLPGRIVVVTPENPDAFIRALTAGSPLAYKLPHESTRRHAQGSPHHQAE